MRNAVQLNNIFTTDDVNIRVKIFTDTFIERLNECAPFITRTIRRPYAHWRNDEVLQATQLFIYIFIYFLTSWPVAPIGFLQGHGGLP